MLGWYTSGGPPGGRSPSKDRDVPTYAEKKPLDLHCRPIRNDGVRWFGVSVGWRALAWNRQTNKTGDKTFNAAVTRESRGMKRALMTPEDVAAAKDKLASDKADSMDRALREVISINIGQAP